MDLAICMHIMHIARMFSACRKTGNIYKAVLIASSGESTIAKISHGRMNPHAPVNILMST